MRFSKQILALMAALATGSAAAASAGTTAGQTITNVANATFDDPTQVTATTKSIDSTPVNTIVNAITGFDIVYKDGSADDVTAAGAPTSYKKEAGANTVVATSYTVFNNSNIDGYRINISADTTDSSATAVVPSTVRYFPAGTTDFVNTTPINFVTLAKGAQVDIIQVITVPAGAVAGKTYSASPKGQAPGATTTPTPAQTALGIVASTYGTYDEASNQNIVAPATTPSANVNGDLQYTRVTVTTPAIVVIPPTIIPGGTPPADPKATTNPGPTPPLGAPAGNTYAPPVNTGVTNNPGTVTVINASNDQEAYPKADNNAAADVVTFVGNVKNSGTVSDRIIIQPTVPANATSVVVLDSAGTPIPAVGGKYDLGAVAVNGTVEYQLVVTYPDSDSTNPASNISVPVAITSGNVPSAAAVTNTFTIHPPAMLFGDTVAGLNPNPALTPTETVIPTTTVNTTTGTSNDGSAVFPMSVKNTGQYTDTFVLRGSVTFALTDGTTVTVPVRYYTNGGVLLTVPDPTKPFEFLTPSLVPGATGDFYAVVNVPVVGQADPLTSPSTNYAASAQATTGSAGAYPDPRLTQTASGSYSTASASDSGTTNGDLIRVGAAGNLALDKYFRTTLPFPADLTKPINSQPLSFYKTDRNASPKDVVNYLIVAKNNYNTAIPKLILRDSNSNTSTNVFNYNDFQSISTTLTGFNNLARKDVNYSLDAGATWSTTVPTSSSTISPTNGIWVYVDTDGVAGPSAADIVPVGATIRIDISTTVK
jgi:hypothetical protein